MSPENSFWFPFFSRSASSFRPPLTSPSLPLTFEPFFSPTATAVAVATDSSREAAAATEAARRTRAFLLLLRQGEERERETRKTL